MWCINNHIFTLIDAQNAFVKIQFGNRRECPQTGKGHLQKSLQLTSSLIWLKTGCFPPKIRNNIRISALTAIQYFTRGPTPWNKARLRNRRHIDWRGRNWIVLFTGNIIGYVEILNSHPPKKIRVPELMSLV